MKKPQTGKQLVQAAEAARLYSIYYATLNISQKTRRNQYDSNLNNNQVLQELLTGIINERRRSNWMDKCDEHETCG